MGRIIAISSGDLDTTKVINEYAVKMLKGDSKNVLFIGTASNDAEGYIERIDRCFSQIGCEVKALQLATKTYTQEEIEELFEWADIIYVGGGDTIFMMNLWKKHGLDTMLKEVYQQDSAILMGISAGAICWFDCGCTDSELAQIPEGLTYGWTEGMLGLHNFAFCPHYEDRVEDFAVLMKKKDTPGLALESETAFVEENGIIYYIKCREDAKGFLFHAKDGKVEKEEVGMTLI